MAPMLKLTQAMLKAVAASPTLSDLLAEPTDLENDLEVLLDWLQPYYRFSETEGAEPLARVRAAAKRFLRDKPVHQEFVRLYLNSIALQFHLHFGPFVATNSFAAIAEQVAALDTFYYRQTLVLNLSPLAADLFSRGLTSLFLRFLDQPRFLLLLSGVLNSPYNERSRTWLHTLAAVGMRPAIQEAVVQISASKISHHVASLCSRKWDRSLLLQIEEWVRVDLYPIFALGSVDLTSSSSNDLVQTARDELISLRVSEIFKMVLAFPLSETALGELHQCFSLDSVSQAQHRATLVDTFNNQCQVCLLHLGSNTTSIALAYIKTIKSFLIIDPTGVLLDKVARPIRKYLRSRADLVSQLVRGMLDLNPKTNPLVELAQELSKGVSPFTSPIGDLTDLNWYPDPIDALPDFKKGKMLDVVEALTSIFSLPGVFVEEFTRLFGDRLLQWDKYNAADILRYVELLKARFGESEFATLDVMVKDIQESAVINARIAHAQLSLTILSKIYWPTVADSLSENDYFNVPIDSEFKVYCNSFKNLRPGRDLALIPSLGTVIVELSCDTGSQEYEVSPAQATVIELFHEDMDAMSLLMIAMATRMSNYAASQALNFWVGHGVLSVSGDVYQAVNE